jgi:hypothetical protein
LGHRPDDKQPEIWYNVGKKRDILDRWLFGLGTLNIQTAGMSGLTGAEESLVGLPNVQEVYTPLRLVSSSYRRLECRAIPIPQE